MTDSATETASGADDGAPQPKRGRPWLRLAVVLPVTGLIVWLLIRNLAGTGEFLDAAKRADPGLVAVAFALATASVTASVVRWQQALRAMGYRLPFVRAYQVVLASWPLSVAAPSRAGDMVRPFCIREHVPVYQGASSVLAEKAIDVFTLLVAGLVGSVVYGLWSQLGAIVALMAGWWLAVAMILRGRHLLVKLPVVKKRAEKIHKLSAAFDGLLDHPRYFAGMVLSSLTVRLLTVGIVQVLLRAVGVEVGFVQILAPFLLATLVGLLPITLSGVGTRDAAFIVLVAATTDVQLPEAAVLAATMGYTVVALWSFGIIGIPFMLREALPGSNAPG